MEKISRRTFVAGALAAGTAGMQLSAEQKSDLQIKVEALPEGSAAEGRKKAMLRWAAEDVAAARLAGMTEDAAALTADIEAALPRPLGNPSETAPGLFPKIVTRKDNPWLDRIMQKVRTLIKADQRFPRGSDPEKKNLNIRYG